MFDSDLYAKAREYHGKPWYSSVYCFNMCLEKFGIGEMIGKTKISTASILLLWCGCSNYDDGFYWKEYEPHLARELHKMWAKVLGIDIGDNIKEEFPHQTIDLLQEPEKLVTLVQDFDIVFDGRFSETQNMCRVLHRKIWFRPEHFQNKLRQEVGRILKPQWIYIVSGVNMGYDFVWQNQNGEMELRGYTLDSEVILK